VTLGIAAILRGVADAPLVLDEADAERLADAARAAGGSVAVLDSPMDKATILLGFADGLAFPAWWGRNWDALEELLVAPAAGPGLDVVVWRNPGHLAAADAGVWATVYAILVGAIANRRAAGSLPFVVIFTGLQPGDAPVEDSLSESQHPGPAHVDRLPAHIRQLGRVHHVALIVRDIDESLVFWRDMLGLPVDAVMHMEHDRSTIAFLPVGESKVELVMPTDDTTGVARFLANKGEGFHHVCFEVDDLAETLTRLSMDGIELIDSAPRKGGEGPVAFLHPKSCHGVLVELIEAPGGPAWTSLGF